MKLLKNLKKPAESVSSIKLWNQNKCRFLHPVFYFEALEIKHHFSAVAALHYLKTFFILSIGQTMCNNL